MCKFDLNVTETGFRFIAKYLILIMHASYWPSYLYVPPNTLVQVSQSKNLDRKDDMDS